MSGLFIEILNMSLSAGCAALVVIILRLLMKKAPKKYAYMLWAIVFFRFIFPFSVQLPMSAVPVVQQPISQSIVYSGSPSIQSGVSLIDSTINNAISLSLAPAADTGSANPMQVVLGICSIVWLAGIIAVLMYTAICYLRLKRRVRTAIRVSDGIYETDQIKTPFVLGFFSPKIYVPLGLNELELQYIVRHEQTHITRRDYLVKPLVFMATTVHWFNPLAWVAYTLLARDMELSADERVMKQSDDDIRSVYSGSLLTFSARRSGLLNPLAFGETSVNTRIKNVLKYKKPAFLISFVSVVVVIAASLLLLGNATESGSDAEPVMALSNLLQIDADVGESRISGDQQQESEEESATESNGASGTLNLTSRLNAPMPSLRLWQGVNTNGSHEAELVTLDISGRYVLHDDITVWIICSAPPGPDDPANSLGYFTVPGPGSALYFAEDGSDAATVQVAIPIADGDELTDVHIMQISMSELFPNGFAGQMWAVIVEQPWPEQSVDEWHGEKIDVIYVKNNH